VKSPTIAITGVNSEERYKYIPVNNNTNNELKIYALNMPTSWPNSLWWTLYL